MFAVLLGKEIVSVAHIVLEGTISSYTRLHTDQPGGTLGGVVGGCTSLHADPPGGMLLGTINDNISLRTGPAALKGDHISSRNRAKVGMGGIRLLPAAQRSAQRPTGGEP